MVISGKVSLDLLRNCYRMNELILTRKDLIKEARELPLDEVQYYHIAKSLEPFNRAAFVKVVDKNGQEKILKDKYDSKRI